MFAVIKTGGKQYRVAAKDVITVAKLAGEPGEAVTLRPGPHGLERQRRRGRRAGRLRCHRHGRGGRADPRREGDRLQEAPPPEFAPQARASPGLHRGADHRDPCRRREAQEGCGKEEDSEGRRRRSRSRPRPPPSNRTGNDRNTGATHGTQKSRRFVAQRSRFGRPSSRRQEIRRSSRSSLATSSCVSAAPNFMRAPMSAWAKTTPSLPRPTAASDFLRVMAEPSYRSFRPKRPQSKRREQYEGAPAGITPTRRIEAPRRPSLNGQAPDPTRQGRWDVHLPFAV